MKLIAKLGLFIFIILSGFILLGIYWTFYRPLPDYSATIQHENLIKPVDVHWDPYGTPYIYSDNDDDLYFTIGYVHAQERLWQMTLTQIAAEGRFSEFFGPELIDLDKHQKTLGFWHTAKTIEDDLPSEVLDALHAYSNGVNAFIQKNEDNLPIEFSLLDVEPISWTPTHTIALTRLMAWDQNIHWRAELAYAYIGHKYGASTVQQLLPIYSDRYPTTLSHIQKANINSNNILSFNNIDQKVKSLLGKSGAPFGSNAWAVKSQKTEQGAPILAGDPHMGLSIPGFWFELYYRTPGHEMAGATIPGSPFIVLGQNNNIAWSMTNMMADDTDFFIESVPNGLENGYVADSNATPVATKNFDVRYEVINVKGENDILHPVYSTDRGPVITAIHPDSTLMDMQQIISMSWMGHQPGNELLALYKMNRASNVGDFREAVKKFKSPAMNFIYADRDDNIALFAGAGLPIRENNPVLFRRGWVPEDRWTGTIPFEELPHLENPEKGYVAHANNKMHTDLYPYYIATFWESPSRIMRIEQELEFTSELTLENMQALQVDVYSEHAREITEIILPVLRRASDNRFIARALPYLENWDYQFNSVSTAASIFDLFFMKLSENVLIPEIGEEGFSAFADQEHLPVQVLSRLINQGDFFIDAEDADSELSFDELIHESMIQTVRELEETFGNEPYEWRWENVNTITLSPPMLGEAAEEPNASSILKTIVNTLFNKGPYPAIGHAMSINKAQYSWNNPFKVNLGPSIRRIVDFSEPGRSLSVLPTGQSGNPLSANYGDQTNLWLDGRYRFVYRDSTFFQQTSYQTMTFNPE
jgi:penicillin amidase